MSALTGVWAALNHITPLWPLIAAALVVIGVGWRKR